jgi:hypothetical protein
MLYLKKAIKKTLILLSVIEVDTNDLKKCEKSIGGGHEAINREKMDLNPVSILLNSNVSKFIPD